MGIDPHVKWNLKACKILYDACMLMIKHLALVDALSHSDLIDILASLKPYDKNVS